jgi:endonuclease YncB( thermonuclease family)
MQTAQVLQVLDGDTISVSIDGQTYRLRYIGIDTPEDGALFAGEATEINRALVEGKPVLLEKDVSETDRYGRLLRYVYLTDGALVNAALVRLGFARAAAYPPDTRYQGLLRQKEQEAQAAGLGIWGAPTATPSPAPVTPDAPTTSLIIDPACSRFNAPGDDNANKNEEYLCLTNSGEQPSDLTGWSVHDSYGWSYVLPAFSLAPGASVRLRTGCGADTAGDLYWCRSDTAIWNNGGDCASLLDAAGLLIQEYCY